MSTRAGVLHYVLYCALTANRDRVAGFVFSEDDTSGEISG